MLPRFYDFGGCTPFVLRLYLGLQLRNAHDFRVLSDQISQNALMPVGLDAFLQSQWRQLFGKTRVRGIEEQHQAG